MKWRARMERFKKEISSSESKNKMVITGYVIQNERKGGGQASINIPSEFFEYLLHEKIVEENESYSEMISKSEYSYNVYSLSSEYSLDFGPTISKLIGIDKEKYGFFIINAENSKPQMRPTHYNVVGKNIVEENFAWLGNLIENSVHNSTLTFYCDTDKKTFSIEYKSNIEEKINNAFIKLSKDQQAVRNETESNLSDLNFPIQKIYFGAPGTGKSHNISKIICEHLGTEYKDVNDFSNVFRSTMFSDFSYHDFIGTIMPIVDEESKINYSFEPGVFTKALVYAFQNPLVQTYLVLEEMSRANMASVFGDIFQLLDRNEDGKSSYSVNNDLISHELSKVDDSFFNNETKSYAKVYLPKNFSILGTVNSTDQNVFTMDTAFKRRFDFQYVSTEPKSDSDGFLNDFVFKIHDRNVNWIIFYQKVNKFIVEDAGLTEDKQIGQFFIKGSSLITEEAINENTRRVKDKLLNYLWFDVKSSIFTGTSIFKDEYKSFSEIYSKFENADYDIFNFDIEEK